jgi:hypothetical protein
MISADAMYGNKRKRKKKNRVEMGKNKMERAMIKTKTESKKV